MFYDLFRLSVDSGVDLLFGDADPRLLQLAATGNGYVQQFLSFQLTWEELLEKLESLGIDPQQYEADVRQNLSDRGLLWLY